MSALAAGVICFACTRLAPMDGSSTV